MIEADDEFKAMVEGNVWHDRGQFDHFIAVIKDLSRPRQFVGGDFAPGSNRWSWAKNHQCKYVDLRIDMRDGGFVMKAGGERISLEQLQWQYDSEKAPRGSCKE